jgi:hypothetical protein
MVFLNRENHMEDLVVVRDMHLPNRDLSGRPADTEDERAPSKRKGAGGGHIWNGKGFGNHDTAIQPLPRKNEKKSGGGGAGGGVIKLVSFYFIATGTKALVALKKTSVYKCDQREDCGDCDTSSLTSEALESISRHKTNRETCGEYVAFQLPALVGSHFNHVEICYHDVEVEDPDTGESYTTDMTFTSNINTNGPAVMENKDHPPGVYQTVWRVQVTPELFYASYEYMVQEVQEREYKYTFFWFFCIPFLDTCMCTSLDSCCHLDTVRSCARLAADCLLSLKFGDDTFYTTLNSQKSMNPDDIHAIMERFEFVMRTIPHDVMRGNIRQKKKASMGGSALDTANDIHELKNIRLDETDDSGIDDDTHYSMIGSMKSNPVDPRDNMVIVISDDDDDDENRELDEIRFNLGHSNSNWLDAKKEKERKQKLKAKIDREEMVKSTEKRIKRRQARLWEKKDKDLSYFKEHKETSLSKNRHSSHFYNPSLVLQFEKGVYTISSGVISIQKEIFT